MREKRAAAAARTDFARHFAISSVNSLYLDTQFENKIALVLSPDRMGKLFRENPIEVAFSQAVNLFSARAKFVREGSQKSTVSYTASYSYSSCFHPVILLSLRSLRNDDVDCY